MNRLIDDITKKANRYGIRVVIKKEDLVYVKGEVDGCAGYFDPDNKVLAIASKGRRSDWLGVLIHESCHLDQWVHDKFMWDKLSVGYSLFFDWLLNKKIVKREVLEECVQDIIRLEKDCEIRSVKKIEKYNVDIDIDNYKRKANSYLYSYLYMLEHRKWIPKLYNNEGVWSVAPKNFPKQYVKIPVRLYRAFKRESHG